MTKILYTYGEAADLLGLPSAQALRDLIYKGRGPVPTRIGARVLFAYADLAGWAAAHRDAAPPATPDECTAPPARRKRGRPSVADRQREIQQQ